VTGTKILTKIKEHADMTSVLIYDRLREADDDFAGYVSNFVYTPKWI